MNLVTILAILCIASFFVVILYGIEKISEA